MDTQRVALQGCAPKLEWSGSKITQSKNCLCIGVRIPREHIRITLIVCECVVFMLGDGGVWLTLPGVDRLKELAGGAKNIVLRMEV